MSPSPGSPTPAAEPASDDLVAARARVEAGEVLTANRAWWDAQATDYYAEHGAFLGDKRLVWGPEGWTEDELDLLGEVAGRDVLEVGAGAAQGSRFLSGRRARVVASDLSIGMLRQGRAIDDAIAACADPVDPLDPLHPGDEREGSRPSARRVPLVQCDGCILPFPAQAFDIVFTAYGVLPFIVDAPAFFAECARVLRPGGRLVAAEPHPIRWCFPDEPDYTGLTVTLPYWDRRAYTERDASGRLVYAETHPTIGSRLAQIVGAGLTVERLVEPEWPDHNPETWGGWSPLRGQYIPGSAIWVARRSP